MYHLSALLKGLPSLHESRMQTDGYALWVVWADELSDAVTTTLRDYGGLVLAEDSQQALWFFFTKDVFNVTGRLQVWANLNTLPVFMQILPARLQVGFQLERTLSIASELYGQQAMVPDEFQVWVHPKVRQDAETMPGVVLQKAERQMTGLASASWHMLSGDPRIGFKSSMGWYFILKPLGNPMDKAFIEGWRAYFGHVEGVLKRLKFKYIVLEEYLLFEVDSCKALDIFCREVLSLITALKESEEGGYWPSVMVAVEKEGYQFNDELPKKVRLDWDQIAPDFPHMNYRSAFLLGERYRIKDVSYSFERSRMTDWCYVHLAEGGELEELEGDLNVSIPVALLAGKERPCFYCGLRSHTESECPTRNFSQLDSKAWKNLGLMGLPAINLALEDLGTKVREDPSQGIADVLEEGSPATTILQSIFEINAPAQLRSARLLWRSMGKELPSGFYKLAAAEKTEQIRGLEMMLAGETADAEQIAKQGALRNPRDFQYRCLQGFLALERGDVERAVEFWKEAEPLGDTPMHFAYFKYLQGRGLEVQGRYDSAMTLYKEAYQLCPRWTDALYRQAVCMIKMGFSEHAVGLLDNLVDADSNMFNRIIIDPEAERGYIQILSSLYARWTQAASAAEDAGASLNKAMDEVEDWFGKDHEYTKNTRRQIGNLLHVSEIQNYVIFHRLISGKARMKASLREKLQEEIEDLGKQGDRFRKRLKHIHGEIAWFPFPRALREFNKDFNFCVTKLNWVKQQHFKVAKNFRLSHEFYKQVEEKLDKLSSRLVSLKIVRDATLFILLLGKSFMWLEIVGLGLALVGMPLSVYFAEKWQIVWITDIIEGQRWGVQKSLVVIVSVVAFVISLLRTAIVFEGKKEKFFEEQRELADKVQRMRSENKK